MFNNWYEDSLYEQALRLDGEHQRDLIVRNPTYPAIDLSGAAQLAPSVTRVAADVVMPQITRASFGVEHAFASWAQCNDYFISAPTTSSRRQPERASRRRAAVPALDLIPATPSARPSRASTCR